MKIISPFKDYYDHAVHASMIDPAIRFIRRTSIVQNDFPHNIPYGGWEGEELWIETRGPHSKGHWNRHTWPYKAIMALLTIGSRAYPVWVNKGNPFDAAFPSKNGYGHIFVHGAPSYEIYERCLLDANSTDEREARIADYATKRYLPRNRTGMIEESMNAMHNFDSTQLCMHYQTPVLLVIPGYTFRELPGLNAEKTTVVLNPPLTAFHMQNVVDPFTAWQDISMFIGGVMPGACSPMVELSNESKIEKAGFDKKISFRTRKAAT